MKINTRYKEVGIQISNLISKVKGAIVRWILSPFSLGGHYYFVAGWRRSHCWFMMIDVNELSIVLGRDLVYHFVSEPLFSSPIVFVKEDEIRPTGTTIIPKPIIICQQYPALRYGINISGLPSHPYLNISQTFWPANMWLYCQDNTFIWASKRVFPPTTSGTFPRDRCWGGEWAL